MTWFRIDDDFYDHPKVKRIPKRYRLAAVGLWAAVGMYCTRHLTDGRFTEQDALDQLGTPTLVRWLVDVGLWSREADGSLAYHDWTHYQESRAKVLGRRQGNRERVAKWREKRSDQDKDDPVTPLQNSTRVRARAPAGTRAHSRPDPISTSGTSSRSPQGQERAGEPSEPTRVESLLAEYRNNSPRGIPTKQAERLAAEIHQLTKDGYTDDEIRAGMSQLRTRGVGPSVLPSLVDEYANKTPNQNKQTNGKPLNGQSTTDLRIAQALAAGEKVSREERMKQLNDSARPAIEDGMSA